MRNPTSVKNPIAKKSMTNYKMAGNRKQLFAIFLLKWKHKRRKNKKKIKNKNIFKKGLDKRVRIWYNNKVAGAGMAQSVEHVIGNDEVISSILITSSKKPKDNRPWVFSFYFFRISIRTTAAISVAITSASVMIPARLPI